MASMVFSHLSLQEQSSALLQFLGNSNQRLGEEAARNVCQLLSLFRPVSSATAAKKLRAALLAHGVTLKHSNALEAIAKMCGSGSWMRAVQGGLPFPDSVEPVVWLRKLTNGDSEGPSSTFDSLGKAVDALLSETASVWLTAGRAVLATLHIGERALCVDLEHESAPWLTFQMLRICPSEDGGQLAAFERDEVAQVCSRLERHLEYKYPGLVVVNAIRPAGLDFWRHPTFTVTSESHSRRFSFLGELQLFVALDAYGCREVKGISPNGDAVIASNEGDITLTTTWNTNDSDVALKEPLEKSAVEHLLNRMAHLRRCHEASLSSLFMLAFAGPGDASEFARLDASKVESLAKGLGLTPAGLADKASMPVNAVLRALRAGFVHESQVVQFAAALGVEEPNELIEQELTEGMAIRIQDGRSLIKAMIKGHHFNLVIGDAITAEHQEAAAEVAQSLREYVELLQFSSGDFGEHANIPEEPVNEEQIAAHIQTLLNDLEEMGIAVLVRNDIRFVKFEGRLAAMSDLAMHYCSMYLERIDALQTPFTLEKAA